MAMPQSRCTIHFFGGGALQHAVFGFASVGIHHAVADETVADLGDDADLLDGLGDIQCRDDDIRGGLGALDDFEQFHDVGGAEEMQPDHVLGPLGDCGNRVDVEGRGIGAEDRPGFGDGVEPGEDLLL